MKIIIANWKMNLGLADSLALAQKLVTFSKTLQQSQLVICPSFTAIALINNEIAQSSIKLGAQDCCEHDVGAYTGDVSAKMLAELGCKFVILGHSERRSIHQETSIQVSHKAAMALKYGITPIICVGESTLERNAGQAFAVVKSQLEQSLPKDVSGVIIAYEPIWAIGTGVVPALEQIEEMHLFIKESLLNLQNNGCILFEIAPKIVYGGSVNSNNCKDILKMQAVNGLLVGGASLVYDEFCKILV